MEILNFINRGEELGFLGQRWKDKERQLIVMYGRRRVGKTELITHFSREKPHIYFLADKRGTESNSVRFSEKCARHFGDPPMAFKEFDQAFRYLANRVGRERVIVIIDEFSYLVEKDPSIPSVFQLCWDEMLKGTSMVLVLCGSSISMMQRGALSYESPLYGRRTGQWKVLPLPFRHVMGFFPGKGIKDIVPIYAVAGGIPMYLRKIDPALDLSQNILMNIFAKGTFLYEETRFLLQEELRDVSVYESILAAMAAKQKLTDIANLAGIPANDLPKYLSVLKNLELIEKQTPVTEKKSKRSLYRIKDNFFRFWFRFAYPFRSELEEGRSGEVLERAREEFIKHVSAVFEDICREAFIAVEGGRYDEVGKWWGSYREGGERRTQEIDIVALDQKTNGIAFAECKWQDDVDSKAVLEQLRQKSRLVEWNNEGRKEKYVIFAKSFRNRTPDALLFDLADLERIFRKTP